MTADLAARRRLEMTAWAARTLLEEHSRETSRSYAATVLRVIDNIMDSRAARVLCRRKRLPS